MQRTSFLNSTSSTAQQVMASREPQSIEIVQNIALSEGGVPVNFIKTQLNKSNGKVASTTRSAGAIRINTEEDSVYSTFYPLCETVLDKYGKNNRAVIIFHYADGSSKTLNQAETVKFWNRTLGVDNAEDLNFTLKANFNKSTYSARNVVAGLSNGRFLSARIVFSNPDNLFSFIEYAEYNTFTLIPQEAEANFNSKLVELNSAAVGFSCGEDFYVDSKANKPNFSKFAKATTSQKRREGRRARHTLDTARKSVKDLQNERANVQDSTTPVAESTSDKLDAILAGMSQLQQEVKELKAENAALRAENEALKNGGVVDNPEPEVEKAAVVETKPASKGMTKDEFFKNLNQMKAAKVRTLGNPEEAVDEFSILDVE